MEFTFTFLKLFMWAIYFVSPLLLLLASIIVFLGQIVTHIEKWNKFDGLYWSFVTATTLGYGDISPLKRFSKVLSVFIALTGIIFTGIILAAAVETVSMSLDKHLDPEVIERMKDDLGA
ncbi:MAG: potassium channel family protein [Pseudomonadota bacterium]